MAADHGQGVGDVCPRRAPAGGRPSRDGRGRAHLSMFVPLQSRSEAERPGRPAAMLAAAAALRELVLDTTEVAQWVWGPEGLVRVSPQAAPLFGLPVTPSGRTTAGRRLPDLLADLLQPVLTAIQAGAGWDGYELEQDVKGSDGVPRRLRPRARSVPGQRGWTVGTIEPVATPLADVEDRYRLLLELSPDALIVHEAGIIVYANPAAVRFARATDLSDLLGHPIVDFVAPDSL